LPLRRTAALLLLTVASLASAPGVAHALGVRISIRGAGEVQETSIFNLVGAQCGAEGFQSPPTTPTNVIGAQCVPGSPTGGYPPGSTIEYVAIPAPGYEFRQWQGSGLGTAVICNQSSPPATSSTYSGSSTCRFVLDDNLQTQAWFADDTDPAMAALSGPTGTVSAPATFSFSAVADPTLKSFECRVPGWRDAWAACASGIEEDPPSGSWQFEVRAVDFSNNRSPVSSWAWAVDKQAPETSLTGGPSGVTTSGDATFTFESTEPGDFVCRLDGGAHGACVSGIAYADLPDGSHRFEVWARDTLGRFDPTPAERTWTVDTLAPETSILVAPPATTTATSATIQFGSSEPAGAFRCQLDQGAPVPCSSPYVTSGLAVGAHILKVWASDGLGHEDATPAQAAWTVQVPAPPQADPPAATPPAASAPSSPPPPPSPGPTRALAPARAISLGGGALKLSKGAVPLKVACPAGRPCSGTIAISATKPRLALGRATYRLAAGKRGTLRVKLSPKGLQLLRKAGRLKVKVAVAGRSWTRTLKL
jgi:Divergent InlB B-repeat domain